MRWEEHLCSRDFCSGGSDWPGPLVLPDSDRHFPLSPVCIGVRELRCPHSERSSHIRGSSSSSSRRRMSEKGPELVPSPVARVPVGFQGIPL